MKILCIDDKNRPADFPASKWIKKEEEYTPTWIFVHLAQGKIQGVQLEEINLDDSCYPYVSFKLDRFAIRKSDIDELIQLMKDCGQFSEEDSKALTNLIKESELQLID